MQRLWAFIILVFLVPSSHAAISRDGSGAGTTSFTFSGTATGDLKLVFAYRSGSLTAPTLPAGWTTISSGATASGGTTGAYRIGCNVSSSGADTGSGTWTNATNVAGASYSGTLVDVTGDCNSTGVGNTAANNAKTSTTVTYGGVTVQGSNNWVAGFMGDSAASLCTPTGMTNITSSGDADANDTNATVSSWSSATCAVSSSTWMSFVAELLGPVPACSGTCPTLVQSTYWGATNDANGAATGNAFKLNYPNPSLSNNFLVLNFTTVHGATVSSVADNKSQTWTAGPSTDNGTFLTAVYFFPGSASGVTTVTITFSAAVNEFHAEASEFYNVATSSPSDGSASSNNTSGVISSGSFTPATNGDLIYAAAMDTQFGATLCTSGNATTSLAAGFGFALLASDLPCGGVSEYKVQTTAAAINPSFSTVNSGSDTFSVVAQAFKSASAGTAPSAGIHIDHVYRMTIGSTGTKNFRFPSDGNLLVISVDDVNANGAGNVISSMTTMPSNSFTKVAPGTTVPQLFYVCAGSTSNVLSGSFSAGSANSTLLTFYDISGAATSCHDTDANASGTQGSVGADVTAAPNITPSTSNGLVIDVIQFGNGPPSGSIGTGFLFDNAPYTGDNDSNKLNNGDGYQHIYNTSTSQQSFGWHMANTGSATTWSALASAFKAPAPGGPPANQFPRVQ